MTRSTTLRSSLALAFAIAGGLGLAAATSGRSHGDNDPLAGSYRLQVTVVNPPLGTFIDMMTFVPNGRSVTSTRTGYLPVSPAGALLESPGHGTYEKTGRDRFNVVVENLLQGAPGNLVLNGDFFATERISWDASVSGRNEDLSGPWSSTFTDANGNLVLAANGTITAVRIQP